MFSYYYVVENFTIIILKNDKQIIKDDKPVLLFTFSFVMLNMYDYCYFNHYFLISFLLLVVTDFLTFCI